MMRLKQENIFRWLDTEIFEKSYILKISFNYLTAWPHLQA